MCVCVCDCVYRRSLNHVYVVYSQLPFSCLNFHELLLAVTQATREKAFEVKYISIVARYFKDFAEITDMHGYHAENMVSSTNTHIDVFYT